MRLWAHLALAAVLLLWSTRIGDEAPLPPAPMPSAPVERKPVPKGDGRRNRKNFDPDDTPSFDRGGFLKAFARQAERELYPCLRLFKASPASLGLAATFEKATARLSDIRGIQGEVPSCVPQAISAMRFPKQAEKLRELTVTVQWRVDW